MAPLEMETVRDYHHADSQLHGQDDVNVDTFDKTKLKFFYYLTSTVAVIVVFHRLSKLYVLMIWPSAKKL